MQSYEMGNQDAIKLYDNSNPYPPRTFRWYRYNIAYNYTIFHIQRFWSREKYCNFEWKKRPGVN